MERIYIIRVSDNNRHTYDELREEDVQAALEPLGLVVMNLEPEEED